LNPTNPRLRDTLEYDALNRCVRRSRGGDAGNVESQPNTLTTGTATSCWCGSRRRSAEPIHNVVLPNTTSATCSSGGCARPSPLRSTNQWDYDANGQCTIQKDWGCHRRPFPRDALSYDGLGRLESVRDPLGNTVTNRYDLKGNLLSRRWDGITPTAKHRGPRADACRVAFSL
jgi:YD repeat-containing protein